MRTTSSLSAQSSKGTALGDWAFGTGLHAVTLAALRQYAVTCGLGGSGEPDQDRLHFDDRRGNHAAVIGEDRFLPTIPGQIAEHGRLWVA